MRTLAARRAGAMILAGSIGVLLVGAAAGAATSVEPTAQSTSTEPPDAAVAVLPTLDPAAQPAFDPAAISASVLPLLADPALGPAPGLAVLDGSGGTVLLEAGGATPLAPASSLKIATGTAVLTALGPQARISTRVVREADGTLVLVGGGDPTLRPAPSQAPGRTDSANLTDLAAQTAAGLRAVGVAQAALRYDASLFPGPALLGDWAAEFVAEGIVSPVSALTLDRLSDGVDAKTLDADPAGTTANVFAAKLAEAGITVTGVAPGAASGTGELLATVQSPPLVAIVDRMLNISDNDVAEALFRLAAIGQGLPGSFDGGRQAVTATLTEMGVPTTGLDVKDGSGLSRNNRISALTLASLLADEGADEGAAAAPDEAPDEAAAASLTWLPPGLPVGGLTGSLAGRFADAATVAGAGRVHAKTGTLTGVTSLTGLVTTEQGRPLAFAVITNQSTSTPAAQHALDRIAAALAACGCAAPAP